MLHSKLVRFQLVFFSIIAVIGVGYAAFAYAGVQRQTGIGMYTVTAELEDAGGLYENALVTYRGSRVGTVTDVSPGSPGARAKLQIYSDYKIPADLDARVRSISAVGEQFIDLIPRSGNGSRLKNGDVITADRTHLPVPTTTVIEQVSTLLKGVPRDDLDTTLREASTTLTGMGKQLNTGLSAMTRFVDRASKNLDPTLELIESSQRPLTQIEQSDKAIATFSTNLASFTQQLTMSDGAIRLALDTGDGFFDSTTSLMQDLTPTVPVLLSNLQSVGQVVRVNLPGVRHILVVYPAVATAVNTMHTGLQDPADRYTGQGRLDLKLFNTANPIPCTHGYQEITRRDPSDLSTAPAPENSYCKLKVDDFRGVRGARNLPCATNPAVRTADVAKCPRGLPSTWPELLSRPGQTYQPSTGRSTPNTPNTRARSRQSGTGAQTTTQSRSTRSSPTVTAVPYDPATGRFRTPTGTTYNIGTIARGVAGGKEKTTWPQLFLPEPTVK